MTTVSATAARPAVGLTFLLHGVLIGAWVPHVALAKERLGVGPAVFGLALLAIAGGGRLEPEAPGRGIAVVTTLGYGGFLMGPPLIGLAAQLTNLPAALFLTVIAALVIALYAGAVKSADTC
jgi:hypothetical protein